MDHGDRMLLQAILSLLNEMPRRNLRPGYFWKDTYELAGAVQQRLNRTTPREDIKDV